MGSWHSIRQPIAVTRPDQTELTDVPRRVHFILKGRRWYWECTKPSAGYRFVVSRAYEEDLQLHTPSLYKKKVKDYFTDLVNRGWIKKSKSPYPSPIVCVRKKDMSLRLCIDYRYISQKSVQTRQAIPRIQDSLDSLKGNEFFSTLDQAKACNQGYVKPDC